jgi:membrane protein implicated in regulation of membrane protease activity
LAFHLGVGPSPAELAENIAGKIQTGMIAILFVSVVALVLWLAWRSANKKKKKE